MDKDFIKSRLTDSAFPSYSNTGKTIEKNFPKVEFDALKILLKKKDVKVQNAHKGNTVVILNRKYYVLKTKNTLNDRSTFLKGYINHTKVLHHFIHMENRVQIFLKS